ncbi:hypothetical protein Dsin_022888 [Dipteronia sinensis]|uniref:Uncharacterized protein n=1 Tax=Dipteronia sinensis TaxID=43782 RepID=A0AAE0A2M8_9ROSI|nr:hypothetical protein Dsin_022888 [Dipteronia sinensis]
MELLESDEIEDLKEISMIDFLQVFLWCDETSNYCKISSSREENSGISIAVYGGDVGDKGKRKEYFFGDINN